MSCVAPHSATLAITLHPCTCHLPHTCCLQVHATSPTLTPTPSLTPPLPPPPSHAPAITITITISIAITHHDPCTCRLPHACCLPCTCHLPHAVLHLALSLCCLWHVRGTVFYHTM